MFLLSGHSQNASQGCPAEVMLLAFAPVLVLPDGGFCGNRGCRNTTLFIG